LNSAGCHGAGILAPHSPKPWRSNLGGRTHSIVDASNAGSCAGCHTAGANSGRKPSSPPPAGTPAGCFNNTLCHGVQGHESGWNLPSAHGAAALSPASGEKGFSSCTTCHGAGYTGGTAEQSCLSTAGCHHVNAPHPPKPWLSKTGFSHTKSDTSNAGQCALCHTGGANSGRKPSAGAAIGISGCFNNTLCHGTVGHPENWKNPSLHGAEAKKAPSASTGFSSCQVCHGVAFTNGSAPTCLNSAGCHGVGVNAPHPAKPWFDAAALKHTTTSPANAGTCAICHTAGANSTVKPPFPVTLTLAGCFNNTLCHFHQIPYAPSATISPSLHGGEASKDLTICQACHGQPGSTSFNGITLANGTKTTACSSCHTAAKAHPTDWQGSGTYSHRIAGNRASACALCHDVRQGAPAPLANAPSCFSSTFTNGLGQSRGCHPSGPGVVPHGVPYNNHNATARSNFTFCLSCHQIPANAVKPPGCQNCHLLSPQTNATNCISCHAKPPSGSVYPNIGKSHATHNALNTADPCAECHSGMGLGTVDHLNRARLRSSAVQANPVTFGTLAKTGGLSPSYNSSGACLNTYCHGASLTGGSNKSPQWGQAGYLQGCGTCHGFPPANSAHANVTAATSCAGCHKHVNSTSDGFVDATKHINGTLDFTAGGASHPFPYPGALHAVAGATVANCSGCHNTTAAGPFPVPSGTAPNCRACHITSLGVGCADCHASPPSGTATPNRNLSHSAHTSTCSTCHQGGGSGNLLHGYGNTTVVFSALAVTGGLTPAYNNTSRQCTNTYCHGGALAGGSNKAPIWGQSGYNQGCGTCHGFPPAIAAHANVTAATSCAGCHKHVNATNNGFIDAAKHVNGTIEVTVGASHAFPYPGSLHATAGANPANCSGCHDTTSTGPYPVASGTAPNCRACHLTSLGVGCTDCHSSPPNGNAFPNTARRHRNPGDHGVACAVCHAGGGSGTTTHGNSGGTLKTSANVKLQFSVTGTVASDSNLVITRSGTTVTCNGRCHITNGDSQNHSDRW
jgi:predicted CxxxxCH...CXXCH cytochrome family protein